MPCRAAGAGTGDAGRRVAYLSDEWIDALDAALGQAPPETAGPGVEAGVDRLVVQYRVQGGPDGPRSWHLDLAPDRLRARAGEADGAAVTFTQPWSVAAAVASGRRSATEALLTGDVAVSGDASALLPWRQALRRAGDALAALSGATDVPTEVPDEVVTGAAGAEEG
jgi:hypothetical protein